MTKRLDPETRLRRHMERQQRRYAEFVSAVINKPKTTVDPLFVAQFSQVTPRLHTIVSDWSPDEHGNPTRTIRARE